MTRYRVADRAAAVLALSGALLVGAGLLTGLEAQVAGPAADFSGYATGTLVHADAIQGILPGVGRLVDLEVASSGAAANVRGLAQIQNEMQRIVQPAAAGRITGARGTALEVGINLPQPNAESGTVYQVFPSPRVDVAAPPSVGPVTRQTGPVTLPANLLYAALLRGQGQAAFETDPCGLVGADLSSASGFVADVQLLGSSALPSGELVNPLIAIDHPDFPRATAQSFSRTILVPQVARDGSVLGSAFGLMAESRQTFVPITLARGTANQTTIEILGEWTLQAVAGGVPGSAFIHYGPRNVSPETPILRTINAQGQVSNVLTFQQVFGSSGLELIPRTIPLPIGEVVIGEDPRAIGGDATTQPVVSSAGLQAAAAVDVLRIRLNVPSSPTQQLVDLRVGHMEARVQVPAGGIDCPVPVAKAASPSSVQVGEQFATTITVTNPFECPLEAVRVADAITTEGSARFRVASTAPAANSVPSGENLASGSIVWNDIGPIPPNSSKAVTATLLAQGGSGAIVDNVAASGSLNCPPGTGFGSARVAGQTTGRASVAGTGGPLRVGIAAASPSPTPSPTPAPSPTPVPTPTPTATAGVLGEQISRGQVAGGPLALPTTGLNLPLVQVGAALLGIGSVLSASSWAWRRRQRAWETPA